MNTPQSDQSNIAEMVGSRICHDLVSPLGALANGIEMLEMSFSRGSAEPAELALIRDSVACANARLKFFRLAFGQASAQSDINGAEFQTLLPHFSANARVRYHWHGPDAAPRSDIQVLALLLLCVDTALPFGGDVHIGARDGTPVKWSVQVESDRLQWNSELWRVVADQNVTDATPPPPQEVQFALLPPLLAKRNRPLNISAKEAEVHLIF